MRCLNQTLPAGRTELPLRLVLPDRPRGLVVCVGADTMDSELLDEQAVGLLHVGEAGQALEPGELSILFAWIDAQADTRRLPIVCLVPTELDGDARTIAEQRVPRTSVMPPASSTRAVLERLGRRRPRGRAGSPIRFQDLRHAAMLLADALAPWIDTPATVVLGIPRAGALLAEDVARRLGLPHDVLVIHRDREVTLAPEGVLITSTGCPSEYSPGPHSRDLADSREALEQREHAWRGPRPAIDVAGRDVVVVDLAMSTGDHMHAAATWAWTHLAKSVTIAVPVASRAIVRRAAGHASRVLCLQSFVELPALGQIFEQLERVTPTSLAGEA